MAKFTITEEAESPSSESLITEATHQEAQPSRAQNSVTVSPEDSGDTFTLKTKQAPRRGRPPGSKNKTVVQAVSEAPADYKLWAQLFIGSANTVVVTWLGSECSMERREAEMLEPPVARMLQRLPQSQSQKIATFIDPMVVLIALGMWGNRIIRIQRSKRQSISPEELARATGMSSPPPEVPTYQQPVEADLPQRPKVDINPNGVPVAITDQLGEV